MNFFKYFLGTFNTFNKDNSRPLSITPVDYELQYKNEREKRIKIEASITNLEKEFLENLSKKLKKKNLSSFSEALLLLEQYIFISKINEKNYERQTFLVLIEYYKALKEIEVSNFSFSSNLFTLSNKHVIVFEGLPSVGKGSVIDVLKDKFNNFVEVFESIQYFGRRNNTKLNKSDENFYELLRELPPVIHHVILFLELYRLSYFIIKSDKENFFIKEFYHAYIVNKFLVEGKNYVNSSNESDSSLLCLDWPFDLPIPEIVLYCTCTSENRMLRLNEKIKSLSEISDEDINANYLYSQVKGVGTVGILTNDSIEDAKDVILEALDFFGVYSLTRSIKVDEIYSTDEINSNEIFNPDNQLYSNIYSDYISTVENDEKISNNYINSSSIYSNSSNNNLEYSNQDEPDDSDLLFSDNDTLMNLNNDSKYSTSIGRNSILNKRGGRRTSAIHQLKEPIVSEKELKSRRESLQMGLYSLYL